MCLSAFIYSTWLVDRQEFGKIGLSSYLFSLTSNYHKENLIKDNKIELDPHSGEKIELGLIKVGNYEKEIVLTLDFKVNNKREVKEIKLIRLTAKDLENFKKQGGKPDYPWFKQSKTKKDSN